MVNNLVEAKAQQIRSYINFAGQNKMRYYGVYRQISQRSLNGSEMAVTYALKVSQDAEKYRKSYATKTLSKDTLKSLATTAEGVM